MIPYCCIIASFAIINDIIDFIDMSFFIALLLFLWGYNNLSCCRNLHIIDSNCCIGSFFNHQWINAAQILSLFLVIDSACQWNYNGSNLCLVSAVFKHITADAQLLFCIISLLYMLLPNRSIFKNGKQY